MTSDLNLPESPFFKHLWTNYAPSDAEVSQIRDFIAPPSRRVQEIDEIVNALLAERTTLISTIDAHKALTHPIRRIPQEILQLIFLECLPTDHFPTMDVTAAPIVLTRVCQSWRALALDTRHLWSSIHIVTNPIPNFDGNETSKRVDRVVGWLSLANDTPLSISLFSEAVDFGPGPADLRLRNIIFHRSHQIRELRFKISEYYLMEFFTGARPGFEWPLLEKLAIDLKTNVHNLSLGHWLDDYTEDAIFKAPRLKSIELNHVDCLASILPLKWSQMEEIQVYGLTGDPARRISFAREDIRQLLHYTPNLRVLHIAVFDLLSDGHLPQDYYGPPKPIDAELVLHELTTLHLCDSGVCSIPGSSLGFQSFLDDLRLPSLTHLSYDRTVLDGVYIPSPTPDAHPLLRFLRFQRQPLQITSFAVNFKVLSEGVLIECLRLMPALEHLWVYHEATIPGRVPSIDEYAPPLGDRILVAMSWHGSASLCPRLRTLRLARASVALTSVKVFCEERLKLSRTTNGTFAPLARIQVDIHAPGVASTEDMCVAAYALEDVLKERGVDATINLRSRATTRRRDERDGSFNPSAGLKTPEETWPNSAAVDVYTF
ncbi:hypothetical protein NMY22_g3979 [Coprinellus aureogranulatus]|nr:hypothetical protein NMY22_g3979 [Coprinellus aureogranulatus]